MGTAAGMGETACPKTWAGSGLKPPCPSWADGPAVGIGFSFFFVQATDGHLSTDGHRRSTASCADGRHLPTVVFAASHRGTLCRRPRRLAVGTAGGRRAMSGLL